MTELRTPSQRPGSVALLKRFVVMFLYIVPVMAYVAFPLAHVLAEPYLFSMRPDVLAVEMGKHDFVFVLSHGQRSHEAFAKYPLAHAIFEAVIFGTFSSPWGCSAWSRQD